MNFHEQRTIVVTGATGRQGGAVVRHLLLDGWKVQAVTRNPAQQKALRLATLGAVVVRADMDDPTLLRRAFEGAYGVYSVQNPYPGGIEAEIRQGKNVADAVKGAGVAHLVYGSAGFPDLGTGVPSWESKQRVEEHMRALDLPVTVLRPTAFMELMTDKQFYPALTTWHVMPRLMGSSRRVPWLCTDDLGVIAAKVFQRPEVFIGKVLTLASDVRSIDECRTVYREVLGKNPRRFPMPPRVFAHFGFVGKDLTAMWQWLRTAAIEVDPEATRSIHPGALSVEAWLRRQKT